MSYPKRPRAPRAAALGVTPADYARMLAEQDGHCALCDATPKAKRFAVDHDHHNGAVRGLLCWRCNVLMPHAKDSEWFVRAAQYVKRGENLPAQGRIREMRELREAGESLQAIADRYGLSRQRVHQIIGGAS